MDVIFWNKDIELKKIELQTNKLHVNCCKRQMTSKVIRHNGVFLWNNLPVNIRQQVTLSSFKTKVKLYLFCMYCI